jgi:hypothetical protein
MIIQRSKSALERAIASGDSPLTPDVARTMLQWHLSEEDNAKMDDLMDKSKQGALSEEERADLAELCDTVDLLSLIHLRARLALGVLKPQGA